MGQQLGLWSRSRSVSGAVCCAGMVVNWAADPTPARAVQRACAALTWSRPPAGRRLRSAPARTAAPQLARHRRAGAGALSQAPATVMIVPRESVLCLTPYAGGHGGGHAGAGAGCRSGGSPTALDAAAYACAELRTLLAQPASPGAASGAAHPFWDAPAAAAGPAAGFRLAEACRPAEGFRLAGGPPTAGTACAAAPGAGAGNSLSGGGRGQQSFLESLRQRDALAARRSWAAGGAAAGKAGAAAGPAATAGLGGAHGSTSSNPCMAALPSTSALLMPARPAPGASLALGALPGAGPSMAPHLALSPPRATPLSPPRAAAAHACPPCLSPVSTLPPVLAQTEAPGPAACARGDAPARRQRAAAGACSDADAGRQAVAGTPRPTPPPTLHFSKPAPRSATAVAAEDLQQAFFAAVGVALAPTLPGGAGTPRPAGPGASRLGAPGARQSPGPKPGPAAPAGGQPRACGPAAGRAGTERGGAGPRSPRRAASCQWGALEAEGRAFASAAGMDSDSLLHDVLAVAERVFAAPLAAA